MQEKLNGNPELNSYDYILVAFSGGKDSAASFLSLLEAGADPSKIELMHHDIDGREEGKGFMDWPVTPSYCAKFAAEFNVPIYFSWREGGFLREMLRDDKATARTHFETPAGLQTVGGLTVEQEATKRAKLAAAGKSTNLGTRLQFPQVGPSLSTRWCSASLKVDVCSIAINNQARFIGKRVLVVSGERAQESASRAMYNTFEVHKCNALKRTVHAYRPVHKWSEAQVWEILQRWNVNPHPAYKLAWGRLSCAACIFGSANQWASVKQIFPDRFERISKFEQLFGKTINRTQSVLELAHHGSAYAETANSEIVAQARSEEFTEAIRLAPGTWTMPAGAFKACGGPS
jgi:3'-phosphoadenosine 5'-phosphosulfate sulfotransferase (PAPS reductase)/FAD synthetase